MNLQKKSVFFIVGGVALVAGVLAINNTAGGDPNELQVSKSIDICKKAAVGMFSTSVDQPKWVDYKTAELAPKTKMDSRGIFDTKVVMEARFADVEFLAFLKRYAASVTRYAN